MRCKECLIWQQHLEANKIQQLKTIPALARLHYRDNKIVSHFYEDLKNEFAQLIVIMDEKCSNGQCKLYVKQAPTIEV